jgi:hypothetical protein
MLSLKGLRLVEGYKTRTENHARALPLIGLACSVSLSLLRKGGAGNDNLEDTL